MKKAKLIGFNPQELKAEVMAKAIAAQNERFVEYAESRIRLIGDAIQLYDSKNHMDDTGNLLDSLCWGVCYDGKMVASGFYREQRASRPSSLHSRIKVELIEGGIRSKWKELKPNFSEADADEPVNGHQLAADYLAKAHTKCKANQWMVFFAILAPYWGYWEKGFNMKVGWGEYRTSRFVQFSVMTEFYDKIKGELSPAKPRIKVHVEKYASKSLIASARRNLRNPKRFDEW